MSEGSSKTDAFTSSLETTWDGVFYLVIGSIGVFGHLAALVTFMKGNIIQSPKHVLYLHFTLANIGVVVLFPLQGISLIKGRWMFGDDACNMYGFVTFFSGLAAMRFMAALAVERYIINCWTEVYCRLSAGHMHLLSLLAWAHALVWAAMPAMGSGTRYTYAPGHMACSLDWTSGDVGQAQGDVSQALFIKAVTAIYFITPFTSAAFCLALANMAIERIEVGEEQGECMPERQLLKITSFAVTLAFLTWTPWAFNCHYSVMIGGDKNSSFIRATVPALLAKTGTTLISLIYPLLSPQFRNGFTRMLVGSDKKEL